MTAIEHVLAARAELHKSTYWPAAQRQKGVNHLWQTDVQLAAAIDAWNQTTVGLLPYKGCSPGARIMSVADRVSWELPEIAACFGKGSLVRLDYGGQGSDQAVQDALDAGLEPLLIVGGTIHTVPTPALYAQTVTTAVNKWKGKVRFYEIGGNEPDLNGQTPFVQSTLVKAGYTAAKAADPSCLVLNGGLGQQPNQLTYAAALIPLITGYIDHFNMHLYEDATTRATWNGWDRAFHPETFPGQQTVRQLLDANGMKNVPISSTESGASTMKVDEATQAKYVRDAYQEFATRRANGEKVGFLLIYCMRDDELGGPGYGLCRTDHSRRPAWNEAHSA